MRSLPIPANWPFRTASRHIACKPHLWHVQDIGSGPTLLLLHGAGGATHSWRNLLPLLIPHHRVIVIDLPGQGFTTLGARGRCGLDAMAQDIAALMAQEAWQPQAYIGHSAGAAIALRLAEIAPVPSVIGINAAVGSFEGVEGWLFPAMAKMLALTPLVPQLFSKLMATPAQAKRLLASTGSKIEAEGEAQYLHLLRQPAHVDATLAMMAQWNLEGLLQRLPQMQTRCLLITGSADRAVPAEVSKRAANRMPQATWVNVPGYGHLIQEEAADAVAKLILDFVQQHT